MNGTCNNGFNRKPSRRPKNSRERRTDNLRGCLCRDADLHTFNGSLEPYESHRSGNDAHPADRHGLPEVPRTAALKDYRLKPIDSNSD